MGFRTKSLAGVGIVVAGISGFLFSQRSLDNLKGVHPDLQTLSACALDKTTVDFIVIDGLRTEEEHKINVANGRSWVKRSRHQDGLAIDFAAYVNGKVTYNPEPYRKIATAFYYCSDKHGIPITWGGEWKVRDYMHIELHRGAYP